MDSYEDTPRIDYEINTYILTFGSNGEVRANRSPFGTFTIEDIKRMGLGDKLFKGDMEDL